MTRAMPDEVQPRSSEPHSSADSSQNAPAPVPPLASQPRSPASSQLAQSEVVQVDSSSSEERATSQQGGVVTVRDTPHQSPGHQHHASGDSSDDVPLMQRSARTSRVNSDEGSNASSRGRSRVSWQEVQLGYSGIRCPMCGITCQGPDEHNPFTCRDRNDGFTRSEAERQWLLDFSALTRAWRARTLHQEEQPPMSEANAAKSGHGFTLTGVYAVSRHQGSR
jgi:hypothetical protein